MTAKEKAEEMVEKMWLHGSAQDGPWMDKDMAKECALIAVDEILGSLGLDEIAFENEDEIDFTSFFKYWREVKQEIEKL